MDEEVEHSDGRNQPSKRSKRSWNISDMPRAIQVTSCPMLFVLWGVALVGGVSVACALLTHSCQQVKPPLSPSRIQLFKSWSTCKYMLQVDCEALA